MEAFEGGFHGSGEGADGEGFGEAGDAFEEDVAVGEEGDEEAIDEIFLADEHAVEFGADLGDPGGGDGDAFGQVRRGFGHGRRGWAGKESGQDGRETGAWRKDFAGEEGKLARGGFGGMLNRG